MNGIFSSGSHIAFLFIGLVLCAVAGYFIGAVNSALIVSKVKYHDDIRNYGSGNAGMTNMLRTYGKGAAAVTLIGDLGKGIVACLIGTLLLGNPGAHLAGLFCMIGHVWPVYFKFKGGKGVLVLAAIVLYCNPLVFLILMTVFVLIVSCTKYISLGSIVGSMMYPLVLARFSEPNIITTLCSVTAAILVFFMHMPNIQRLREGKENKLKLSKSGKPVAAWKLVIINSVLVLTVFGVLFGKIAVSNSYFERSKEAAVCQNVTLSGVQMRYEYLDFAKNYLADEKNKETDIVKNYDPSKKYSDQYIGDKSYAQFFMEGAKANTVHMLSYYAAAVKSGVSAPEASVLDAVYADIQKEFYEGETLQGYLVRVYGTGMKNSDVRPIFEMEAHVGKYITYIGYEKSAEEANAYSVTFDEEVLSDIMGKY